MRTKLYVRQKGGEVWGEIADFTQFDAVIRKRDVGSWSVKMPMNDAALELMKPGAGIVVEREQEDGDDGEPDSLISGPMTQTEPQWSADDESVVISGLSDLCLLWDLLVFPPNRDFTEPNGFAFANDAYDVRDGIAEEVIKYYVAINAIDPSRTAPGIPLISIGPDLQRGSFVTCRGRFQILGDLLQEAATAGGDLGLSIQGGVFDVSMPRDLRAEQVFSVESGNLTSYDFKTTAPTATASLVAGGGEDVQRVFVQRRDSVVEEKWGRHIETFIDRRDTKDLDELAQSGDQALIDKGEITAVNLQAIDVPSRRFGTDWNVGDYVTVQDIEAVIREVKITLDENGETVTPTVDSVTTVTAQSMLRIFDAVRELRRQVNFLQRTL